MSNVDETAMSIDQEVSVPSFERIRDMTSPVIETTEEHRKELIRGWLKRTGFISGGVLLLGTLLAIYGHYSHEISFESSFVIVLILTAVVLFVTLRGGYQSIRRIFNSAYKDLVHQVAANIISEVNKDLIDKDLVNSGEVNNTVYYDPRGISSRDFLDAQVSPLSAEDIDVFDSEDTMTAQVGRVPIMFSEVRAFKEFQVRDRVTYHRVFEGLWVRAEFNKEIESFTTLRDKSFKKPITGTVLRVGRKIRNTVILTVAGLLSFATLATILASVTSSELAGLLIALVTYGLGGFLYWKFVRSRKPKMERVELESSDFNNTFKIDSTSQVDSRYILTSAMMERLLSLRKVVERPINVSFIGDSVYFGIQTNGEDYFNAEVLKPLTDEFLKRDYKWLAILFGSVLTLDLNTRIYGVD